MINEFMDIMIDTVLVTMVIIFGLCNLCIIWAIIEDIKQHNERSKENGTLHRHNRK